MIATACLHDMNAAYLSRHCALSQLSNARIKPPTMHSSKYVYLVKCQSGDANCIHYAKRENETDGSAYSSNTGEVKGVPEIPGLPSRGESFLQVNTAIIIHYSLYMVERNPTCRIDDCIERQRSAPSLMLQLYE